MLLKDLIEKLLKIFFKLKTIFFLQVINVLILVILWLILSLSLYVYFPFCHFMLVYCILPLLAAECFSILHTLDIHFVSFFIFLFIAALNKGNKKILVLNTDFLSTY